jgi:hypothetical protein
MSFLSSSLLYAFVSPNNASPIPLPTSKVAAVGSKNKLRKMFPNVGPAFVAIVGSLSAPKSLSKDCLVRLKLGST